MSKCMDEANMMHSKANLSVIEYVIDKKNCFFQMKPSLNLNILWQLRGYSDVDYTRDNNTPKIVTGCTVLINIVK